MNISKYLKLAVIFVAALSLNACGGGGGGGSTSGGTTGGTTGGVTSATTQAYKLVLKGTFAASAVKGLQFDLVFPSGVTLNIDSANSAVLASSLGLSGLAPSEALLASKFSASTLSAGILTTAGLSAGEFATITCNIDAGVAVPAASSLVVSNVKAIDTKDAALSGVSVSVN